MSILGKYLLAIPRLIIVVVSLFLVLVPYVLSTYIIKNTPERAFKIRRAWTNFIVKILGLDITYKGQSHSAPVLYVSNHRSFSDPLVFAKFLDAYVIAKAEVENLPLISTGAQLTGILYVDRAQQNSRSKVKEMMVKTLGQGYNVLVYPEGTTSNEPYTLDYKPGTFMEAAEHNIPVVPIVIDYKDPDNNWYYGSMYKHHLKQFSKLRTSCYMEVGPPITHTDGKAIKKEVLAWTNNKITEIRKQWQ